MKRNNTSFDDNGGSGVRNRFNGGGNTRENNNDLVKKHQDILKKTTIAEDIDGAFILLTSVKKKVMEAEILASMEHTLTDRDDERGLWVTGHVMLTNGECVHAYFSYPSEVRPKPTGNMPYCLKLFGVVHSSPNDYTKSEGDPHKAYDDDKFCVQSFQTSIDATFITLMMHPFDINVFGLHEDAHRMNRCNMALKNIKWIDMDGAEWTSVEGSSLYRHPKSQGNYMKYQFVPDARCREQVKRDLLTPPSPSSHVNVNK
jgi:hypothetical protein